MPRCHQSGVQGKLLFVAKCCPSARLFTNGMLETLHACPLQGSISLSSEVWKDVAWFQWYLHCTHGVFLIHKESRVPIPLFVDACTSGRGVVTAAQAYHMEFPPHPPTKLVHLSSRGIKCFGGSQRLGPPLNWTACPPLL